MERRRKNTKRERKSSLKFDTSELNSPHILWEMQRFMHRHRFHMALTLLPATILR